MSNMTMGEDFTALDIFMNEIRNNYVEQIYV